MSSAVTHSSFESNFDGFCEFCLEQLLFDAPWNFSNLDVWAFGPASHKVFRPPYTHFTQAIFSPRLPCGMRHSVPYVFRERVSVGACEQHSIWSLYLGSILLPFNSQ